MGKMKNILIIIILTAALFIVFKKLAADYISKKLDGTGGKTAPKDGSEVSQTDVSTSDAAPPPPATVQNKMVVSPGFAVGEPNPSGSANNMPESAPVLKMSIVNDTYANDMPYLVPPSIFQTYDVPKDSNAKTVTAVEVVQ